MEKPPRGTGGRVGVSSQAKNVEKLSRLPWPHSQAEAGPGPSCLKPSPGPRGPETLLPSHVNGGARGRRTAPTASPLRNRNWPVVGTRAMARWAAVRSGRGHAADTLPVGPSAGSLISGTRGAKGRRPALPSRRRIAAPPRRAPSLPRRGVAPPPSARHPPPGVAARGRRTAPRGFQGLQRQQ